MNILPSDPKILALAFVGGSIPALLWLWFWLKEEETPEPVGLLTVVFIMGMIAVVAVLPIEKFILNHVSSSLQQTILFASAEEIVKYLVVLLVLYRTNNTKKPIDWPIYLVTGALGFATLENTLYLIKPLSANGATLAMLMATSLGQLRFLGANLLHTIASGTIGIAIGLSFFMEELGKKWFLFIGFVIAIALHSAFNFFIMENSGNNFMQAFAFLWVVTIIIMLLFEKVRRMSEN